MIHDNDLKPCSKPPHIPSKVLREFAAYLSCLPQRPILDCLVRNFLEEANWIHEILHPASFLTQYGQWWSTGAASVPGTIEQMEFGLLVLQVCAYSAQFAPSRTHTADTINDISISVLQVRCRSLADALARLCESAGGLRTFAGAQSLCFAACYMTNEGRMKESWELVGYAIRITQDLGIHLEAGLQRLTPKLNDLEKEMRRRLFWNLYTWDRLVASYCPRRVWLHIWGTLSTDLIQTLVHCP